MRRSMTPVAVVVAMSGGLRAFLAGPAARELREPSAQAVVDEAADDPEHCALDDERRDELDPVDLPVLGPRRLLLIEQSPDEVEELLGDLSGEQPGDDPDRHERELHLSTPNAW